MGGWLSLTYKKTIYMFEELGMSKDKKSLPFTGLLLYGPPPARPFTG